MTEVNYYLEELKISIQRGDDASSVLSIYRLSVFLNILCCSVALRKFHELLFYLYLKPKAISIVIILSPPGPDLDQIESAYLMSLQLSLRNAYRWSGVSQQA